MKHAKHLLRPFIIWLAATLVTAVAAFRVNGSLDIHLHDTYFVIAHRHVFLAIAAVLAVFALLYKTLDEVLFSPWLNGIHIISTLIVVALVLFPLPQEGFAGMPRRYYDSSAWESQQSFGSLNHAVALAVILCFFGQLLFILHILWGLLRLFRRRR